jgi:hypothetical protein
MDNIIHKESYITIEDHLVFLNRIKDVQKRYISREFITRKSMSNKKSKARDLGSTGLDRKREDLAILQKIENSIIYYNGIRP